MDLKLKSKTALITGANRGTGEVIARTMADEGAIVLVHSNEDEASVEVAETIPNAIAVWGDITCDSGAQALIQQTREQLKKFDVKAPDVLINNYGTASGGSWEKSDSDAWLDMYQKNVLSASRLIKAFIPGMKENAWGRIILLGTIGSHQPNSIMPHYYASKGALATMCVSLAKELSNTGITVNTVSPGFIHTQELEAGYRFRAQKKGWGDDWPTILENIVKHDFPNPVGRIASREEVADMVAFLASPRTDFVNGQNIRVDGGAVSYV